MSTYSPSLRITLITTGDQAGTWGNTTNTNLGTLIEDSIAGYETVSVTSANQAFTAIDGAADQARNMILNLTTTTTAAFAVYAPPQSKLYVISNASAYTATIYNSTVLGNTTAAGTGVAIAAGKKVIVYTDGTNFSTINNASVVAVADGGTGATTAAGARTNLGLVIGTDVLAPNGSGASLTNLNGSSISTGTVSVATGGTGATTASDARTNLGLVIGTDVLAPNGNGSSLTNLNASNLATGTVGTARLASGTADSTTFLRGDQTWASASAPVDTQTFNATGTWTKPTAGQTMARIQVWGGGGGGARANPPYGSQNSGGGGGGYTEITVPLSTLTSTVTATVGAGGTGRTGSSGSGTAGGTSSFGSYASTTGGAAGVYSSGGTPGNSIGGGPLSSGSTLVYTIWNGGEGQGDGTTILGPINVLYGGGGGNKGGGGSTTTGGVSLFGGSGGTGNNGGAGTAPGGGGGAGNQITSGDPAYNGGNGAAGRIVVTSW